MKAFTRIAAVAFLCLLSCRSFAAPPDTQPELSGKLERVEVAIGQRHAFHVDDKTKTAELRGRGTAGYRGSASSGAGALTLTFADIQDPVLKACLAHLETPVPEDHRIAILGKGVVHRKGAHFFATLRDLEWCEMGRIQPSEPSLEGYLDLEAAVEERDAFQIDEKAQTAELKGKGRVMRVGGSSYGESVPFTVTFLDIQNAVFKDCLPHLQAPVPENMRIVIRSKGDDYIEGNRIFATLGSLTRCEVGVVRPVVSPMQPVSPPPYVDPGYPGEQDPATVSGVLLQQARKLPWGGILLYGCAFAIFVAAVLIIRKRKVIWPRVRPVAMDRKFQVFAAVLIALLAVASVAYYRASQSMYCGIKYGPAGYHKEYCISSILDKDFRQPCNDEPARCFW